MQQYPTILAGDRITASLLTSMEPLTVVKTADETRNNNNTPSNDTELFLAVEANAVYLMEGWIKYNASIVADINFDWTAPAGSTGEWVGFGAGNGVAAGTPVASIQVATNDIEAARSYGGVGVGTNVAVMLQGTLRTASTAGTYQFLWSQLTAEATVTTILADSWIKLTRVA